MTDIGPARLGTLGALDHLGCVNKVELEPCSGSERRIEVIAYGHDRVGRLVDRRQPDQVDEPADLLVARARVGRRAQRRDASPGVERPVVWRNARLDALVEGTDWAQTGTSGAGAKPAALEASTAEAAESAALPLIPIGCGIVASRESIESGSLRADSRPLMALTLDPHAETPRGAIAYPAPFDA